MLSLIVTLIVIGVLLYLMNQYVPMDGKIKNIINIVVVVCVIVYVLSAFGLFHHAHDVPVPQVH